MTGLLPCAINSAEQLANIRELAQSGADAGAQCGQPQCDLPERGYWFPPTLLTGVSRPHRIAREDYGLSTGVS